MATLHQLNAYLQGLVKAAIPAQVPVALSTGAVNIMQTKVAIGWPPINVLQDAARGNQGIVAVYDRHISRNSTRWSPVQTGLTVNASTLTSTVSIGNPGTMPGLSQATLTINGPVTANDAVSAVFTARIAGQPLEANVGAQVVVAGAADTPATIAASLATAINGDPLLSQWVSAVAVGPVITITSLLSDQITLASYTGNTANRTQEIGRRLRQFQIAVWAVPDEARSLIADPIDTLIGNLSLNPPALPDGTYPRICYVNDHDIEEAAMEDLLRRDFFISADYAITAGDVLFSVLAPIPAYQVQYTPV